MRDPKEAPIWQHASIWVTLRTYIPNIIALALMFNKMHENIKNLLLFMKLLFGFFHCTPRPHRTHRDVT